MKILVGEEKGQKKEKSGPFARPVSPGRPKAKVDVELLIELHAKGYGFKRIAGAYTRETGDYISHMTVRDRLSSI